MTTKARITKFGASDGFRWTSDNHDCLRVRVGTQGACCFHKVERRARQAARHFGATVVTRGFGGFYFFVPCGCSDCARATGGAR